MRQPPTSGTLEFRVNRLTKQDPAHRLVSARQLDALQALLAVDVKPEVR